MNSNIERKLNEVLKAVGNISERSDKLNEKLENFDRRITKLEYLVEDKISKFQQELKTKADDSGLNELHLKLNSNKLISSLKMLCRSLMKSNLTYY